MEIEERPHPPTPLPLHPAFKRSRNVQLQEQLQTKRPSSRFGWRSFRDHKGHLSFCCNADSGSKLIRVEVDSGDRPCIKGGSGEGLKR